MIPEQLGLPDTRQRQRQRIDALDGARGTAMLVVFLAHFTDAFYRPVTSARHHALLLVTRMASPAFICISGMMLGILHHRGRDRFDRVRDRLIDRGLFLIIVGHPLLTVAMFWMSATWSDAFRVLFITDTIGICLILGSLLVTHLGAGARALLGAALLLSSWTMMVLWSPAPLGGGDWVEELLFGAWRENWLAYNVPPLPWLGLYLIASGLGSEFARLYDDGKRARLRRVALGLGLGAAAFGLLLRVVIDRAAESVASPVLREHLVGLGIVTQRLPPTPTYMLFYGGVALIMFAGLLAIEPTVVGGAIIRWLTLFGRTSLVCFVLQFYVYYVGVLLLPRPPEVYAPLYFLATVVLLRLIARRWERSGGKRFLTVGYPRLLHRDHPTPALVDSGHRR